jgi:transketolase
VFVYDDNHITIDGTTALSFDGEDTGARFVAKGGLVQHVADPTHRGARGAAFAEARSDTRRPSLIVVRSHIAYPAPNAIDTAKAHGSPLGEDEVRATKEVLGWDPDEHFVVPAEVREHMAGVGERGAAAREEWERRVAAWSKAWPDVAAARELDLEGRPRDGWLDALPSFEVGEEIATRDAGKTVMQALRPFTPTQIGGAADLVESTKTEFIGTGTFSATHVGRNVPFGIREHGMGAIVNGIALEPAMLKPYGSTFLVFSDYMRPAVRLSALSKLPLMWIWTHDSVGLGEDGPTHQPVEHVMSLRAIPNLWVVRPGDANETVAAWRMALEREGGPVAFALSRQKLPVLGGEGLASTTEGPLRGGYVLWQRDPGAQPDAIVLATGSELSLALEGARSLEANVRVVSLPCWELFDEQDASYREEVLPPSVRARVSIEAGITFGWERWVGESGTSIGVDRFGASAPAARIYEELGLTVDAVADAVKSLL